MNWIELGLVVLGVALIVLVNCNGWRQFKRRHDLDS
jgi:hypothetical protein